MNKNNSEKLAIIGGGTMGLSFSKILVEQEFVKPHNLTVSDRDPRSIAELVTRYDVKTTQDNRKAVSEAHVVLLAVKPVDMQSVLSEIASVTSPASLIISIAAGVKMRSMQYVLGTKIPIVRAMPNTPTRITQGVTVWTSNTFVTTQQKQFAKSMFQLLGDQYYTEDEQLLDKVTAVSASGPAYFYYFTEALVAAAENIGMGKDLAYALATKTFIGAARYLEQSGKTPEELRRAVTSKKGTTDAALRVMTEEKMSQIISRAVDAAFQRAQELGK